MSEINSIGLIELSSVATGYGVEDTMLKAGNIQLLMARSICSGKFLIVVAGDVTSVQAAVAAGSKIAGDDGMLVGRAVIPAPSPELFRDYI